MPPKGYYIHKEFVNYLFDGSTVMHAALMKEKREKLVHEIATIIETWPEQHRQVFYLVHYSGQSPAAISRALALGVEEVRSILNTCERQLHKSLRSFHRARMDDTSSASSDPVACPNLPPPLSLGTQTACR